MRRLVLLVVVLFLLAASPASAGGPTSVLITSPAEERATGLYTSQAMYIELSKALGTNPPVADPNAPDLHRSPGSKTINLTWLLHDVQVWRIDHVFLTEPGGPWVETYESYDGIKFDQRGVVHRPADPDALVKVLYNVLGPSDQSVVHPARTTTVAAPIPAPAPPATGIQWTSLLVGLVGGIVLVVFGRVIIGVFRRTPVNRGL
jgi:hypothetical protein